MCIILAKPRGVEMPSWDIFENCWWSNQDGAGVAFSNGTAVHIRKGLMTFAEFKKYVTKLTFKHNMKEMDFIAHFRITSVGETTPRMTHPFRVDTDDKKQRMAVSGSGKMFAFHNGTITSMRTFSKTYSDTYLFTETILSPMFKIDPQFYLNGHFGTIIDTLLEGDKLALIDKNGIMLYGKFVEDKGIYYSNYGFEDYYSKYGYATWEKYGTAYKKSSGTTSVVPYSNYFKVTDEEYDKACRAIEFTVFELYNNPEAEEIESFAVNFADAIDDITTWEEMNFRSEKNQRWTTEFEALGVI